MIVAIDFSNDPMVKCYGKSFALFLWAFLTTPPPDFTPGCGLRIGEGVTVLVNHHLNKLFAPLQAFKHSNAEICKDLFGF